MHLNSKLKYSKIEEPIQRTNLSVILSFFFLYSLNYSNYFVRTSLKENLRSMVYSLVWEESKPKNQKNLKIFNLIALKINTLTTVIIFGGEKVTKYQINIWVEFHFIKILRRKYKLLCQQQSRVIQHPPRPVAQVEDEGRSSNSKSLLKLFFVLSSHRVRKIFDVKDYFLLLASRVKVFS